MPEAKTMRLSTIFLLAAASILPLSMNAAHSTSSTPEAGKTGADSGKPTLQVSVDVPPSMRPWVSDDIAEAFAMRVGDALDHQGFKSGIDYVDRYSEPDAKRPLLKIRLMEWRTNHVGTVNCTFLASIVTPKGSDDLGLFTGSSMLLGFPRHDWFARREQFDDAARQALSDLYKRIEKTNLMASS